MRAVVWVAPKAGSREARRAERWRATTRTASPRLAVVVAAAAAAMGCELREVTLVEVENVVVAEVYVTLRSDPAENEIRAFLHRTLGVLGEDALDDLDRSQIEVRRADGSTFALTTDRRELCLGSFPLDETGTCFRADPAHASLLAPGELLEIEIGLPDGGTLTGATRVPEAFELDGVPASCQLPPNTLMTVRWSRSPGAWAYLNETSIRGLPDALEPEGIVLDEDPLYLLGLSITDRDTTVVFPSEFGVFNRFELDQDIAVRLQRGLPEGSRAEVTITAVERNYVNWARGGRFNPSGQVRVPSLRGDGTGVFAAAVSRGFIVLSEPPAPGAAACPIDEPRPDPAPGR